MISVLRKTPPIAAENTIPDDGSAPDLRQICANPSLYDYAPFLSFTQSFPKESHKTVLCATNTAGRTTAQQQNARSASILLS